MRQPNVLWICSDQQRFDTLGCYGNRFVRTPNLDHLAAGGVLFERAYCQNPLCTPSRASFLTGRYPRATRARQNGQSIPADEVLVTKLLADADYTCGLSGKLHLSACHPSACKTMERRIDDGYSEFHWSHHPAADWPENEYSQWLAEQGGRYRPEVREDCPYVHVGVPVEQHQTTWCAEKAIDFIRARGDSGRPWLFSVNMFDPHHLFDPPAECLQRYLDMLDEVPLPNYLEGELENKPPWQQEKISTPPRRQGALHYPSMSGRDHRLCRAAYWAMCDLIDDQVGRMLEALSDTGQLDRTVVIFMSDHGEMLGDHGIYLKGPFMYEPAIRVPLIVSWPGRIAPGRRSRALVELTDLAQTLLDAAGLPHHPGMQGRSLWPMLTGQADLSRHREDVYCEYYTGSPCQGPHGRYLTMTATERWKLIAAHGAGGELYDLAGGPAETHNLWDSPDHLAVKAEMLQRLADRMALTADPLPQPQSPW